MKSICLLLALGILTANFSFGQNTFPENGSVGIGTNAPMELLEIFSQSHPSLMLRNSNYSKGGFIIRRDNYGQQWKWWAQSNRMHFGFSTNSDYSSNTNLFTLMNSGNVGIGTISPEVKLDVHSNNASTGRIARFIDHHSNGVHKYAMILYSNKLDYRVMGGASSTNLTITTSLSEGGSFNSGYGNIILSPAGSVAIGTNEPKGYKLAVAGKVIAEEVTIKLQSQWPDYIFSPTYSLRPLSEVEEHINTHGHLPEVPSAQQVEESGIDLGEMNALLLKKVEELTLYSIEQEKRIEELEKQNEMLERQGKEIEELKKLIKVILNR